MHRYYFYLLLLIIPFACSKNSTGETAVLESEDGEPLQAICIWKEIGVRETPAEKGKYLTSIFLGEKVEPLADTASEEVQGKRQRYQKIKLKDGMEGWVRSEFICVSCVGAAAISETEVYKRPDAMTASGKKINAVDFLAVRKTDGEWREVVCKRVGDTWFTTGWVKPKNLTTDETDVAFSIFYSRAMEITDATKRRDALDKLLQNSDLSSSIFMSRFSSDNDDADEMDPAIDSTAAN